MIIMNYTKAIHTLTRKGICYWDATAISEKQRGRPVEQCSRKTYGMNRKSTLDYKQHTNNISIDNITFLRQRMAVYRYKTDIKE